MLAANEVHHVVSKAAAKLRGWTEEHTEADDNLISINSECHKRETLAEQGKAIKLAVTIGVDGWPVNPKY